MRHRVTSCMALPNGGHRSIRSLAREHRDRSTRQLIFVCGGAEGFPEDIRRQAQQKLSLSAMTYSHELARVMLAEQLYRAFATLAGSAYPK